jgi:hypothetical protein
MTIILMTHFISQSAPNIRKMLKRLENGPQTPQAEILNVAFKVYNYREEQQKAEKERRDKAKFHMLAQALQQNPPASNSQGQGKSQTPPGPCFSAALRDTGPMHALKYATHQGHVLSANRRAIGQGTAPPPLKVEGLDPLIVPPP